MHSLYPVTHKPCSHKHPHADPEEWGEGERMTRVQKLASFLEVHFGDVEWHDTDGSEEVTELGQEANEPHFIVRLDEAVAQINLLSLVSIECDPSIVGNADPTHP